MSQSPPELFEIRVTVMVTEDEAEMLADVMSESLHIFRSNLVDPYAFLLTVQRSPLGHNSIP